MRSTRLTLTEAGRRMGEEWLSAGSADELVVRLAVARLVIPERLPALVAAMTDERTATLHRLRAARAEDAGGSAPRRVMPRSARSRLNSAGLRGFEGTSTRSPPGRA